MEKEKSDKKQYKYYTKTITCPDGKRKYIRGRTKKELAEKVKKAMLDLGNGVNINDSTRFGELAQMWLDVYKKPRAKERSLKAVRSRLNTHVMPILSHIRVRDVKPTHIAQVMNGASYLSHGTQALLLSDIKSIFNCAIDNGIIPRSPVPSSVKPGGQQARERIPLTPEECHELLEAAKNKTRIKWAYAFACLCLYTGMRASEACGLCWDCVDFENSKILVRRQLIYRDATPILTDELKTSNSMRDLPAPPQLMDLLRRMKSTATTITVLSTPEGGMVSASRAGHVLSELGLSFHVHPHLLRHTYATRLVENGLDIKETQYLLGHTTPFMTMRVYSHYDRKSRDAVTAGKVANISFVKADTTAPDRVGAKNVANVLQLANQ